MTNGALTTEEHEKESRKRAKKIETLVTIGMVVIGLCALFAISWTTNRQYGMQLTETREYRAYAESVHEETIGVFANKGTSRKSDWYIVSDTGVITLIDIQGKKGSFTHTEKVIDASNSALMSVVEHSIRRQNFAERKSSK